MRRALPAAGFTAAALLMLSRFHSTPGSSVTRVGPVPPASQSAPATTPLSVPPDGGGGAAAGPDTPATSGTPGTTSTTAPASAMRDGSFTGAAVETRWGPVQVQIVIKDGRLTDVQEVEAPDSHERSVEINDQAAPLLRDEALRAQSADLDLVSGATITWDGYRQSLQAALDQAHR